jgi:hypothetical protein
VCSRVYPIRGSSAKDTGKRFVAAYVTFFWLNGPTKSSRKTKLSGIRIYLSPKYSRSTRKLKRLLLKVWRYRIPQKVREDQTFQSKPHHRVQNTSVWKSRLAPQGPPATSPKNVLRQLNTFQNCLALIRPNTNTAHISQEMRQSSLDFGR